MAGLPELSSYVEAGAAMLAGQHGQLGELRFQQCARCGYLRYPIASICPQCLETEASWVADSGEGSVWSFCVYHKAFHPAFAALVPYVVALIELDSGPRIITNIVGVPLEAIQIGVRGRVSPEPLPDGGHLVYFFPSSQGRQS